MSEIDIYYWTRTLLGVVGVATWGWIVRLTYPVVTRQRTPRRRLFFFVVMFMLALWALLLFASSAYGLLHPPTKLPDTFPLVVSVLLNVAVAVSGVLLVTLFPSSFDGDVQ